MKQTKQLLMVLAALMLGAYGTQAKHITTDVRGTAADTVQVADDDSIVEKEIFVDWETFPEYPGGPEAMKEYINSYRQYPQEAKERGKQGRVIVQFIVEEDGTLTGEQVLKPVDPQLDAEAIRIARSMPKWKLGEISGKPTRMRFTFPVSFRLKDWFYGGF